MAIDGPQQRSERISRHIETLDEMGALTTRQKSLANRADNLASDGNSDGTMSSHELAVLSHLSGRLPPPQRNDLGYLEELQTVPVWESPGARPDVPALATLRKTTREANNDGVNVAMPIPANELTSVKRDTLDILLRNLPEGHADEISCADLNFLVATPGMCTLQEIREADTVLREEILAAVFERLEGNGIRYIVPAPIHSVEKLPHAGPVSFKLVTRSCFMEHESRAPDRESVTDRTNIVFFTERFIEVVVPEGHKAILLPHVTREREVVLDEGRARIDSTRIELAAPWSVQLWKIDDTKPDGTIKGSAVGPPLPVDFPRVDSILDTERLAARGQVSTLPLGVPLFTADGTKLKRVKAKGTELRDAETHFDVGDADRVFVYVPEESPRRQTPLRGGFSHKLPPGRYRFSSRYAYFTSDYQLEVHDGTHVELHGPAKRSGEMCGPRSSDYTLVASESAGTEVAACTLQATADGIRVHLADGTVVDLTEKDRT